MNFMVIIYILALIGIIELTIGFESDPEKKLYNYLFNPYIYWSLLVISIGFALFRFLDFRNSALGSISWYLIPVHYLILFKILNVISYSLNKRNFIIASRGDIRPPEYNWTDMTLSLLLICLSVILPILEVYL
jgi:hypothetical protein